MAEDRANGSQQERLRALLAEMEATSGRIPPAHLAEARELWGVRQAAELDLDRDQVVCLAVAELLAERRGVEVVGVLSIPEQEDRTNPAVELVVGSTAGRIALEHTTIESFPGQIQAAVYLRKLVPADPFEVAGLDPDSQYTLGLVPSSLEGNAKDAKTVGEALRRWITEAAAMLPPEPCLPRDRVIRAPEGRLPIPASLLRTGAPEGSPFAGKVLVSFEAPEDREALRVARLLAALDSKLPKLIAARGRDGLAVLVIETGDMSLANPWVISEALQRAAGTCEHPLPDYVVLIITVGDSLAWVLYDRGSWPDEHFVKLALTASRRRSLGPSLGRQSTAHPGSWRSVPVTRFRRSGRVSAPTPTSCKTPGQNSDIWVGGRSTRRSDSSQVPDRGSTRPGRTSAYWRFRPCAQDSADSSRTPRRRECCRLPPGGG